MKKSFKVSLLFSLFVLVSFNVMSQSKLKFGHINSQQILEAMPDFKAIQTTIQSESTKMEKQLTDLREEFQKSVQEYQSTSASLSAEDRAAKEKELSARSEKVQNFYTVAQQTLEAKAKSLQAPVIAKLQAAIEAVGQEGGFLYIFEVNPGLPVFYSAQSVDVSPLVKAKVIPVVKAPVASATPAPAPVK